MNAMDWVLVGGVTMAGLALVLAIYVTVMVRNMAEDILSKLDAKIIEEVIESVPQTTHSEESPAFRGHTRIFPNGVVTSEPVRDDIPPLTPPARQLPTHSEQVDRAMRRV